jgi:hypothetical protein
VERRDYPVGDRRTRQLSLDPVAIGAGLLRPRAVRNDSAGRRPPEMRQSRQPKVVGCGGSPDNLCLATDVYCSCGNSENNKTTRAVWRLIEDDYMVKILATD